MDGVQKFMHTFMVRPVHLVLGLMLLVAIGYVSYWIDDKRKNKRALDLSGGGGGTGGTSSSTASPTNGEKTPEERSFFAISLGVCITLLVLLLAVTFSAKHMDSKRRRKHGAGWSELAKINASLRKVGVDEVDNFDHANIEEAMKRMSDTKEATVKHLVKQGKYKVKKFEREQARLARNREREARGQAGAAEAAAASKST